LFTELIGRWAFEQDRLSPADITDPRIPDGGTEGYFTVDLRVGTRLSDMLRATLTLVNLTNENYRVHGSGIDGPGFGIVGTISGTLSAP
jgi:outer membrane receptor protein involved in Fe transport